MTKHWFVNPKIEGLSPSKNPIRIFTILNIFKEMLRGTKFCNLSILNYKCVDDFHENKLIYLPKIILPFYIHKVPLFRRLKTSLSSVKFKKNSRASISLSLIYTTHINLRYCDVQKSHHLLLPILETILFLYLNTKTISSNNILHLNIFQCKFLTNIFNFCKDSVLIFDTFSRNCEFSLKTYFCIIFNTATQVFKLLKKTRQIKKNRLKLLVQFNIQESITF